MATTDNRFIKVDGSFERPTSGVGSTAETNRLLGGEFFDPKTDAVLSPFVPQRNLEGETSNASGSPLPQTTPAPVVSTEPFDNFNTLMGSILKGAQGVGTAELLKRKRALERAALGRVSDITPEEERALSPSQQAAIRAGRTGALRPEIDDNAYELEKAQQNIDSFFKVFGEAKKLGQEWSDRMVAPDSVIDNAVKVIQADSSKMATILSGFNDKTKEKILGKIDYSKMSDPMRDLELENQRLQNQKLRNESTPTATTASGDQLDFLIETATDAIDLSGASGPSDITKRIGDMLVGDTEFRQLESLTNTLRTNMLTLATDPNIKKFFGPQMSNADVKLMTAGGTTLNPEAQSPEMLKAEAQRILDLLTRMKKAVDVGLGKTGSTGGSVRMQGPQGTFDVPADQVETFKQNGYQAI